MATPLNQTTIKKENKQLVLHYIRKHEPVSRARIAQMTGLNKGTISTLVAELIEEELLTEIGTGKSSGGRKPVLLQVNKHAGYSIGIDIGVQHILGTLTDLGSNQLVTERKPLKETSFFYVVNEVLSMIRYLTRHIPESAYGLIGIGVGVPAIVSIHGEIIHAPNLKWRHVDLKKELRKCNVPIWIDNEANYGALGQHLTEQTTKIDTTLYISAGIGIGAGLLLNGELYKGTHGFAGEVGHMTMDVNGPICRCGNYGCWELFASEQALLSYTGSEQTLEELITLARNGDAATLDAFRNVATYLGKGIVSLIHIFSPDQIIIGNRLAMASDFLYEEMNKTISSRLVTDQQHTPISFSTLHNDATALGATSFSIDQFFQDDTAHKKAHST
ncbi:ROK family protein [Alkalicoccobacillus gibsonii]|uniref:ROK family protein n=1 Tax=Alkalicoccobacillus gibsonii TaxID=79881 RepID=UPI003515CEB7